jgi:hypothetical protein
VHEAQCAIATWSPVSHTEHFHYSSIVSKQRYVSYIDERDTIAIRPADAAAAEPLNL